VFLINSIPGTPWIGDHLDQSRWDAMVIRTSLIVWNWAKKTVPKSDRFSPVSRIAKERGR